jgi:hypothetical protein
MTIERARRAYLLKGQIARRLGDSGMASAWFGKQIEQPGTALAVDFPHKAALEAQGYRAVEDLDGATTEELQAAGLTSAQAAAVLAAI